MHKALSEMPWEEHRITTEKDSKDAENAYTSAFALATQTAANKAMSCNKGMAESLVTSRLHTLTRLAVSITRCDSHLNCAPSQIMVTG